MAYSLVVSSSTQFGAAGGTTGGINTTGATLIVVGLTYFTSAGANLSDSLGNVYTLLTPQTNSNMGSVFYICNNPITSATHFFTTTSHFCGVNVSAWTGNETASSVFDQQSGANSTGSPLATGSLTPTVNNSLCMTVFGTFNGAAPTTPSGYTSIGNYATGTAEGGGCAYLIQTSATATNPSWSGTGSSQTANLVVLFPLLSHPTITF